MLEREQLIGALRTGLEGEACVRAAWLGGSDATGRADAVSDVDLMAIAAPGQTEEAIAAIDRAMGRAAGVRLRYRLPAPTWHGFAQGFVQFEDAPQWLMLDWVVMEQGQKHPWLEVERHGRAVVLFDKDGEVGEAHVDRAAIGATVRKKVEEIRVKYPMFRHLAAKMAARGHAPDAAYFYQAITLRLVVDLLRAVHCPERHDYGFRYLGDDLPAEAYAAVCRLCYPPGPGEIAGLQAEADRLFAATLAAWDAREGIG
ncbi:MAG: nucleotidyltransferase domain-containing protein [Phycisphaerales bacterium]|nr:nucleotidyltransferase domain-containing protein [Phycisphaerales bacterium]